MVWCLYSIILFSSGLLKKGNIQDTTNTDSNSNSYTPIGEGEGQRSLSKLILKRLFILFLFSLFLVVGVLIRMFVHIKTPEDWTLLCIPYNETAVTVGGITETTSTTLPGMYNYSANPETTMFTLEPENITLPYCNFTLPSTHTNYHVVWPGVP